MTMAKLTATKIKREIMKWDPGLSPDEPEFRAAVVLMSSAHVGPNIRRLAKFTGYRSKEIAGFSRNLRKSQIWNGGRVQAGWFGEDGGIALACDINVALGYIVRTAA
jgi:hypothetical protein